MRVFHYGADASQFSTARALASSSAEDKLDMYTRLRASSDEKAKAASTNLNLMHT